MVVTTQPLIRDTWSPTGRTCKTQDYYVLRRGEAAYQDYWGRVVDPDGLVRDRLSDDERRQYVDDIAEELAFIRSLPTGAIADVGCGPGWLLRELPEWQRVGVEIAPQAVAELRRHDIRCVPATRDLPEGLFDVVVAYHVIEHMTDPIAELYAMRDLLRPGGWLVLGTPDFGSPCAVRFGDNYRLLHDRTHVSLFTCESMHRFLRDHMFAIRDVRFPFPARFATAATFARWADTSQVSPPWPGNFMSFYCQRNGG